MGKSTNSVDRKSAKCSGSIRWLLMRFEATLDLFQIVYVNVFAVDIMAF